jgi:hypothetical protein
MKTKLVVLIAMAGMFTFSSCKKCVECTYSGNDSEIHCKPEEYTNKAWDLYLDELESNGYDCEAVGI